MSIEAILALPWYVGELGLVLAALALWSAVWSMISLRFASAIVRLVFVFVLLVILTRNGPDIVRFIHEIGQAISS
jgi:hypothetical protein